MSFGASMTYIYAYVAFAVVYLIASLVFVLTALRVGTGLSRARQTAVPATGSTPVATVSSVINHGQRIVDYTQVATLLPIVYIVGSMFLGSLISRNADLARTVNIGWITFTVACAAASIVLAVLGIRESGAISSTTVLPEGLSGRAPEALQRIGVRLGVSAALLLLVAVFTMLNLWSIISQFEALSTVDFLL